METLRLLEALEAGDLWSPLPSQAGGQEVITTPILVTGAPRRPLTRDHEVQVTPALAQCPAWGLVTEQWMVFPPP